MKFPHIFMSNRQICANSILSDDTIDRVITLKANDEGLMFAFFGRFNSMVNYAVLGVPASCAIPESDTTREVKGNFFKDYKEHERKSGDVEMGPFGIEVHKVIEATYKIADWVVPYEQPTVFMEHVLK